MRRVCVGVIDHSFFASGAHGRGPHRCTALPPSLRPVGHCILIKVVQLGDIDIIIHRVLRRLVSAQGEHQELPHVLE